MTSVSIPYSSSDPLFLAPIRPNGVAIVLADLGSNCHSPALLGHLSHATDPATLAELSDSWSQALIAHGANPVRALAFIEREAARVRESFPVPVSVPVPVPVAVPEQVRAA